MKTTFSRNVFTYAVILLAALLLVGVSFQALVRDYLTDKVVETLQNNSAAIARVAAVYYSGDGITNREFLNDLAIAAKVSQADAVICDATGRLILCSNAPLGCSHQGMHLTNPAYLRSVQEQTYVMFTGVITGIYEETRFVVSTAIRDPQSNEFLGLVMVSAPISSTTAILKRISDTYLFISLLVVLIAVVIMTFYARRTSDPLRHMARAATDFGHGDLDARVSVEENSPAEIRELALAFNNMAGSLKKSEVQRREFVANVSHELKTPMTTISGYVDGILDGTIPPEQQERYLRIVSDETKRLSRLVRSMLDISQLQDQQVPEEKKTRFDVAECAGRVLITFEKKILDKALEVDVQFPEMPVYALADQDAITQVIYNLLDNAVKFCPREGKLGMKIQTGGNKVYVSVSNSGQTIPAKELPLLFDRFHKLDKARTESRDGWGLGLYIVKTIVCGHGEDISVTSENGTTEFTFTLPMVN